MVSQTTLIDFVNGLIGSLEVLNFVYFNKDGISLFVTLFFLN